MFARTYTNTQRFHRQTSIYCHGGYHPLKIRDNLDDGRYRLADKFGYGGYSTIWLARDLRRARYAAMKAITADTSAYTPEAGLLYSLGNSPSRPGKEIIPPLIDEFWVVGPNGKHKCIFTPPARMSLFDAREASTFGLFRPKAARAIIAQLIRGVAFLHSEDIVHRDLHLGNILVQFPDAIDRLSTSELYKMFGEPESVAVVRRDGKPLSNGVPAHVFIPGCDFGESFNPHKTPRFSSKTFPLLQPPAARFSDEPLSFASDIWTLACTVWEIFGQRPLFEALWPTADRVTAEQVKVLGILPPEWWGKWSKRLEWFTEEGELKPQTSRSLDGMCRTWDQRFGYCIQQPRAEAGLETVTEKEKRAFEDMLRPMLTFRPKERATAEQALHSEYMKGWGEPVLEELGYV
ncbi:kinase domain-containing protein [Aspergillus pseudonomiae]|uniref:non-specific serine/threonine protein kinase n=1 Tax=Aspergillus pseudonomiae TaxID=1506151 RepID=A0A5N7D4Z6_9EURO|nr:kinase domain-containing protein [Aspergillus pseudonomiae]KAE8400878.1 kinase domain-containing protein [Aspergillus pseudonomiae]